MRKFAVTILCIVALSTLVTAAERRERDRERRKREGGHAVIIDGLKYQPSKLTIKRGEMVIWSNEDDVDYTVIADDGTFRSGTIKSGASFSHRFAKPGKYSYGCKLHPRMKGLVLVE